MNKTSIMSFFKNYIGLVMIMLLIYLVLGSSKETSFPLLMLIGLPITAIMVFMGLDKKIKKHLP